MKIDQRARLSCLRRIAGGDRTGAEDLARMYASLGLPTMADAVRVSLKSERAWKHFVQIATEQARDLASTIGDAPAKLPERIEWCVRDWPHWTPMQREHMDAVVEEVLRHCREGDGNEFIANWCSRNLAHEGIR